MTALIDTALADLGKVLHAIDQSAIQSACNRIAKADRIVLYGCGREGLQIRGLAMRLHHIGLKAWMQDDMSAPFIGPGDLFITSAGPGELATVTALMRIAEEAGAEILMITAVPDSPSTALATEVLAVPAQTMANDTGADVNTILPMGSLYEGALFVLFEAMVLALRDQLGVSAEAMRANHKNLE